MLRVAFASDHGGYDLKHYLIDNVDKALCEAIDCGCDSASVSVDYPDYAERACRMVLDGRANFAVLVCGTGIGISIAANKLHGIRCALCSTEYDAEMTRRHNDANAVALGGRTLGSSLALSILHRFLTAKFEGGRHEGRLEKIRRLEGSM